MGPPLTRAATSRLFDGSAPDHLPVDHVMIAGICGGLDPDLEVGTLINPEVIIEYLLGSGIPGEAGHAHQAGTRRQVHDRPEALSLNQKDLRPYEENVLSVDT
jgi:hypothetical protein